MRHPPFKPTPAKYLLAYGKTHLNGVSLFIITQVVFAHFCNTLNCLYM